MTPRVSVPLTVRDLARADLPSCTWAGTDTHLAYVDQALERVSKGEVDYLALCDPADLPLAIGGIDYAARPGAGTLGQLVVHPAVRCCGLGTMFIAAAEERIRRGLRCAALSVEDENPRARALYERLGYVACGGELASWTQEEPDGSRRCLNV